jgi:3-oxoacyl-[acyl-carrier protein] reductase
MIVKFEDLQDKVVLITGATRGIGRTIALSLAKQGAHIVYNYREGKEEAAQELKSLLLENGAKDASPLAFDITNTSEMKEVLEKFVKETAQITGVVNNAGIARDQLVLRMKEEDVAATIDTNLKGAIMLTQVLSRSFLRATDVSIVNMSSVVGMMGNAGQIAYAASKAGLIGFTKSYAKELSSRNIRCNAVCPWFIQTEMTESLDEKVKETYLASIPLRRFGDTDEVANLVNFLLSKASSYITGETIKIDGGLYI